MTDSLENLLTLAARELVLAAEEADPIKKSHHQEFADRYFAQALLLNRDPVGSKLPRKAARLRNAADRLKQLFSSDRPARAVVRSRQF